MPALPSDGSPLILAPETALDGLRNYYLSLKYTRPSDDSVAPTASITFDSDSVRDGEREETISFDVDLTGSKPRMQVVPGSVDFDTVPQGDVEQQGVAILNQGTDPLVVDSFILSGHPRFSFAIGADKWPVSPESAAAGITLDEPLVIEAGKSANVAVVFEPTGAEPAEGTLILFSNDPSATSGKVIPLQANVGGPCITVNPRRVHFGGKLVGKQATVDVEIQSCGDKALEISALRLTDDSSSDFGLSLNTLPGVGAEPTSVLGPADAAVVLEPNERATFQVTFLPDEINVLDAGGVPLPDVGLIKIISNAFIAELDVEVEGFGVERECPTAIIDVQEGEEVIPQTRLHLIGSHSYPAAGNIESYRWEVQQPLGSQSFFVPALDVADPTFEVNVAGTYVFRLTVTDSAGEESCIPAEATVFVNPDEAIHVELVWNTPNDPDQTDEGPEAGADLDLHFVHPTAHGGADVDGDGEPDGYFDIMFDAFWYNPKPNWGDFDPNVDDDPGLDRDDTNGAGPENLNLKLPEDGVDYKIGVHYWDDHTFGPSFATIKIYIFSNLVFEMSDIELRDRDMWTVGWISWPSGEVTLAKVCEGTNTSCERDADCAGTCGLRIFGPYRHPLYPN